MQRFDDATALHGPPANATATIDPSWAQGRACFGGVGAGLAVNAAEQLADARPLRSALVQFNAPLPAGEVAVRATVLRAGSAATQIRAEVLSDGQICVSMLCVFGADRRTAVHLATAAPPPLAKPDACPKMPFIEGVSPRFTQHLEYRWGDSHLPFSGSKEATIDGWVRFVHAPSPNAATLLGLIDAWPATVLTLLSKPAMASTITWMVNVHALPTGAPQSYYRYSATTAGADAGYADVDARLWDEDGRLLATSRQLVAEFSAP